MCINMFMGKLGRPQDCFCYFMWTKKETKTWAGSSDSDPQQAVRLGKTWEFLGVPLILKFHGMMMMKKKLEINMTMMLFECCRTSHPSLAPVNHHHHDNKHHHHHHAIFWLQLNNNWYLVTVDPIIQLNAAHLHRPKEAFASKGGCGWKSGCGTVDFPISCWDIVGI